MRPTVQEFYSVLISLLILSFFYIPQSMSSVNDDATVALIDITPSIAVAIDVDRPKIENDCNNPSIAENKWTDFETIGSINDNDTLESWLATIPQNKHLCAQIQSPDHILEDASIDHSTDTFEVIGIADGHTNDRTNPFNGTIVSSLLANKKTGITSKIKTLNNEYTPKSIKQAFAQSQESVKDQPSGSTLSIAIIPNNGDKHIYFANIADSPIYVITQKGEILRSIDHCVNNPDEVTRMQELEYRIEGGYFKGNSLPGGLQPSKDFGKSGELLGFQPTPDVYRYEREKIAGIAIFSDGPFDSWKIKKRDNRTNKDFFNEFIDSCSQARQQSDPLNNINLKQLLRQNYAKYHTDDMSAIITKSFSQNALQQRKKKKRRKKLRKKIKYTVIGAASTTAAVYFLYLRIKGTV